jgi:hypothetical protein
MGRSVVVAAVLAAVLVPLAVGSAVDTGTLQLRAHFAWNFSVQRDDTTCPAGSPALAICQPHLSTGVVPGLGQVSMAYVYTVFPDPVCAGSAAKVLGYSARFTVQGRGEIDFAVAGLPDCFPAPSATIQSTTQPFTVTGGSGAYAGASGNGVVRHAGAPGLAGTHGRDLWEGAVVVDGLAFDVTAPAISGAVGKVVRARHDATSARVVFRVTASDDVDGPRPVTCTPPSGKPFRVGTTRVRCSAADTSGNVSARSFAIVVRRVR